MHLGLERVFQPGVSDSEPRYLIPNSVRFGLNSITKKIVFGNYAMGLPLVGPLIQAGHKGFTVFFACFHLIWLCSPLY